jgi:tetratricopeptide (TPR) repeat protein
MIGAAELSKRYAKGLEFYDQGLLIDALAEFEAVLVSAEAGSPEAKLAAFYTGQVHARLAEDSIQRGAREHAEQHLRKAIVRNPKFPDLHYQLAQIIGESGAIREAMTELEIALKLNPEYAKATLLLGILSYQIGEYTAGARYITHAAEIEPRFDTQIYHDAMSAHSRDEHRKALALFAELALTNVDDISFHFGIGKKRYRSGDYHGAAEAFEQSLSLNSSYPDIRNWFGLALMGCGENEKAFEQFQGALEINPNYVGAVINAGVACEMMGLKSDADSFYRNALELDPDNVEARERLSHGEGLN